MIRGDDGIVPLTGEAAGRAGLHGGAPLLTFAFPERENGVLQTNWTLPTVLAEAIGLLGIGDADGLLRRRRRSSLAGSALHHPQVAAA